MNEQIGELERLCEDASFSAQTYFEASKSAYFWGRSIVFVPAILGSAAALLVALGGSKEWGSLGAIAGAVAATSSFLGSAQRGDSYLDSARRFTKLRHSARMEIALAPAIQNDMALEQTLRRLRDEYDDVVLNSSPASNRFFRRASKRINSGSLDSNGVKVATENGK